MKKIYLLLPLALILYFMLGCQDKEAMAELEVFNAQAAIEEQNKELVKGLVEEFNKGNVESWRKLFAPEFGYYQPSMTTEPMSIEQTIEAFQKIYKGFPDYSWNIHELIAKGDKVIAHSVFTGTHEGEYGRFPATGNNIRLSIISIFQFSDGKWLETREEEDILTFMQQL
ncbi:ester cyclase, partial [Acidobacteriota bacterium]